jgi:hypothetical protein
MPYKYSKIYNVSQSAWARDVSGEDDAQKVWDDNEWEKDDAIIGFYSENGADLYNVIFCQPGYAVYVQAEQCKDREEFVFDDIIHRIPIAILVNLNNAYDTEFIHTKAYECDMSIDDCDCDCDCNEEEEEEEEEEKEEEEEEEEDDIEDVTSHIDTNQKVINFLQKCAQSTSNPYKKEAYNYVIRQIGAQWSDVSENFDKLIIGSSIRRKINEFLIGIPEDDIINS